ncbi:MAG: ATP-binding cassette domain-containing protein [Blautia sp.]|nr:ATP-binding cassette domain-containing protein [Blautia sp.]
MKLEVKNIHKSFGDKEVLHGISFEVESGKALGLLGRNGAGKTTTIRILMDVFHANSGEISVDGKKFVPGQHQIGYLPEERGLYPKRTVIDQMVFLGCLRGLSAKQAKDNARRWLTRLEVAEYETRKLETLSKGNQQKVQLASTLVADPEIIILDEPFSGLDPVNSQILKDVVSELIADGKLVIFSSHQMSYVEEFCEDIAIINKGEVVLQGNLHEIKKDYGMDRLMLILEGSTGKEAAKQAEEQLGDLVTVETIRKNMLVLALKGDFSRKDVMERLAKSSLCVEQFGSYEPSLNDIFVIKVGEEDEKHE